jgi:hypothetical protein
MDLDARIFDFRFCLLLLAAMASTAGIDAQQPAKNELHGSTLDEAEIRKLIDQLGVEQFRLREDATKRLSVLADVPPALRAAMKSDNAEASRRAKHAQRRRIRVTRGAGIKSGVRKMSSGLAGCAFAILGVSVASWENQHVAGRTDADSPEPAPT